jgi:hypothetical protein
MSGWVIVLALFGAVMLGVFIGVFSTLVATGVGVSGDAE